jgi:hypothetical protein
MVSIDRKIRPGTTNRKELLPDSIEGTSVVGFPTGNTNIPTDFRVPANTLYDIDKALFEFFNTSLNLQVRNQNSVKKVPVIFAGGERFALTKSDRPIRDKSGAIIVPVISIKRTTIDFKPEPALAFGVDPGEFIVRRRIHKSDRQYQNLINRFGIKNGNYIETRRDTENKLDLQTALDNPLSDNVYETIIMPTPDFITVTYDLTIWTNYVQDMNQIIERLLGALELGIVATARIETDKGYKFVAHFDTAFSSQDNFDDYTTQERLVKYTSTITIPAYIFGTMNVDETIPVRSYLSAVNFEFETLENVDNIETLSNRTPLVGPEHKSFMLSDVEDVGPDGRIQGGKIGSGLVTKQYIVNPFTSNDPNSPRYSRVIAVTKKGERVGKVSEALELDKISKR